jgi:hypothetical protein
MILIKKGTTNKMSVSVSLNKTLSNPYYLFSFTHIQSKNQVNFIPKVVLINDRYDEFVFVEGNTTDLSQDPPQVNFIYDGQYWVEIYQQTSSGNTDPSQAYSMLWDGRAVVENPEVPSPYYQWTSSNEDNANFIFISDDELVPTQTPTPSVTASVTPTPTITPTSTLTPTPSVTPTITPTSSSIPRYSFSVLYDGDLTNLCSGTGTISLTLWGLDPVFENNTNLYLDNTLSIDAPVGYAEYLGTIVEINPSGVVSGVVVCPSSTPTPTPSITPTLTPTMTPTPSVTPPNNFIIGVGFQGNTNRVIVDNNDDIYVSGGITAYQGYLIGGKGFVKIQNSGAIDLTFDAGNRTGIAGAPFDFKEDETGNYLYSTQQQTKRLVKVDKTSGDEVWNISANNNIWAIGVHPTTGDILCVGGFTSIGGQARNRIALLDKDGNVLTDYFGAGFNTTNIPTYIFVNRIGNWVVTSTFTTYKGLTANRIIELDPVNFNDTGFWGTGSSQGVGGIYQNSTTGEYIIVGGQQTINGTFVDRISKFDELGNNIPFSTTGLIGNITSRGQYYDQTNNLVYVYNNLSVNQLSRIDLVNQTRDITWETTLGPITWTTISPSNTWNLVGKDSNNKLYYVGGLTSVQSVPTYGIARTQQDGTINTANF